MTIIKKNIDCPHHDIVANNIKLYRLITITKKIDEQHLINPLNVFALLVKIARIVGVRNIKICWYEDDTSTKNQ